MINIAKRLALVAVSTVCLAAGLSTIFQPSFALTNGGSITALGAALTENFDTLVSSGSATWTNNSTIQGWYHARSGNGTTTFADAGSGTTGNLYSYGSAGSIDRALGSIGSGNAAAGSFYWGARFTNSTGSTITSLAVNYTGEQWRSSAAAAQTVAFSYRIGANLGTALTDFSTLGTTVPQLDFVSPVTGGTAGALNGNLPANRVAISFTITGLSLANGQEILLRWSDPDHSGTDHGLAIDDLSVTAGGPVDSAPTVTGTTPASSATNVAVDSDVVITFSESVNAAAGAFAIECPTGSAQAFSPGVSPGTTFTLNPTSDLPYNTSCTVTVTADQITDTDGTPDPMASNYVFSFTTASPVDDAPIVTSTTPADAATNVAVGSNIILNFSESVTAGASAFAIQCGSQSFAQSASPGSSFTLNPDSDLPYSTTCVVTVTASQIADWDTHDPPDHLASDFTFSFTTSEPPPPLATDVIINEVDADTPGTDAAEFVELYDGGVGNTKLDGLTVVFFNGNGDVSYAAFDLDGFSTDAFGYFTLGNPGVPGVDRIFNPGAAGLLQQGEDAVALYAGNATDFPNGTLVTSTNLQDAVVYDTADPDDPELLLALLNPGEPQVNENGGGSAATQSSQRCANGTGGARNTSTYVQATPSPDGANICPPPIEPSNSVIVISQLYGGGGNSGGDSTPPAIYRNDYVELYNRGTSTVDIGGWSLQYASADGSGWDFSKQPLGGTIAPGEYLLIALASGGADGAPLPAANITGQINLSGTSGKVALVDSFDGLVGNCPIGNPHVMDLVGYGSADCREGTTTAASPSNTTALFRLGNGGTDTDRNGSDFVTGSPAPRRTAPIVELGPLVLATDPRANGSNAPRDATLQITFTEPVDVAGSWFDITCVASGAHNSATFAAGGQSHYITPNGNFVAGEQCTATIFKDQVSDQDLDDSGPDTDTLPSDYTWSFTVASGTAPPYPASVHLTMGNPSGAIADISQPNNTLMEKPEFALSYDRDLGRPNWVSSHLSDEWFGTLARVDTFRADPAVPADWYRVQSFDFVGSGFDRGHMVPNADRDKETSIPINQATFLMTNMVAQAPDNNQGPWAAFEGYLRILATTPETNEIYIVTGGVGVGGTGSNGGVTTTIANGHVTVPAQTWKVALVIPKAGGDDVSRVTCFSRTIAIIMPNTQGIRNDPWENFLTNVDSVESLTGYDLFSNLPQAIQACVEAGTNGNNPPLDTIAPNVECASPDGAWHADNVALGCSASDSGSGLANAGDASFSLITSVADGSEDANASTDSRVICDVAGNCATAGPIVGNSIDRKDPVITLVTPPNGAVYQLNRVVNAAYSCADGGSGPAACAGTVANGAPIDTSSTGSKAFAVNATDNAGNTSSTTVTYTVAPATISISNIPVNAFAGGSFVPTYNYQGDGATSVTSNTPGRCTVSGGSVTFVYKGTCTLVAHAAGTANFDPATGGPQSFTIDKQTTTISINNLPGAAVNGGSFTPTFAYTGDGITHTRSETPATCRVHHGVVRLVGGGTCTLTARASATSLYYRAIGDPQSFVVGPATPTIEIRNVPAKPKVGKSFVPHFRYDGDGQTSVTSSTPAICGVTGAVVHFLSAGACTLTAHATATANYAEATGLPESFLVKTTW